MWDTPIDHLSTCCANTAQMTKLGERSIAAHMIGRGPDGGRSGLQFSYRLADDKQLMGRRRRAACPVCAVVTRPQAVVSRGPSGHAVLITLGVLGPGPGFPRGFQTTTG